MSEYSFYMLDSEGDPVGTSRCDEWTNWFNDADRHVAQIMVNGILVSTVFLGINHSFDDNSDTPILWETMIFGGLQDQFQWRYSNKDDAINNHKRVINRQRARMRKKHLHPLDQAARSRR